MAGEPRKSMEISTDPKEMGNYAYDYKPRIMEWNDEKQQRFLRAIELVGIEAGSKRILQAMEMEGVTLANVSSHLQKHKVKLRKQLERDKKAKKASPGASSSKKLCTVQEAVDNASPSQSNHTLGLSQKANSPATFGSTGMGFQPPTSFSTPNALGQQPYINHLASEQNNRMSSGHSGYAQSNFAKQPVEIGMSSMNSNFNLVANSSCPGMPSVAMYQQANPLGSTTMAYQPSIFSTPSALGQPYPSHLAASEQNNQMRFSHSHSPYAQANLAMQPVEIGGSSMNNNFNPVATSSWPSMPSGVMYQQTNSLGSAGLAYQPLTSSTLNTFGQPYLNHLASPQNNQMVIGHSPYALSNFAEQPNVIGGSNVNNNFFPAANSRWLGMPSGAMYTPTSGDGLRGLTSGNVPVNEQNDGPEMVVQNPSNASTVFGSPFNIPNKCTADVIKGSNSNTVVPLVEDPLVGSGEDLFKYDGMSEEIKRFFNHDPVVVGSAESELFSNNENVIGERSGSGSNNNQKEMGFSCDTAQNSFEHGITASAELNYFLDLGIPCYPQHFNDGQNSSSEKMDDGACMDIENFFCD